MTTLFEMTKELAFYLMPKRVAEATGGSVTSLVDSLAAFSDDEVGGTLFVFSGDLANKTLVVTSRTGTTQFNFATQTPNDIVAGNRYGVTNSDFGRELIRQAVNEAVKRYAKRREEDDTLETVADQEAYTLPAGVSDVKEVWMAMSTSAPYEWMRMYHWEEVDGELRWPVTLAPSISGMPLRVVYRAAHTELTADADDLPLDVNENLVRWDAAVNLIRDGNMRFHSDPKRDLVNKMNEAQEKLSQFRRNWNEWKRDERPGGY
jgi:hypothetical protein